MHSDNIHLNFGAIMKLATKYNIDLIFNLFSNYIFNFSLRVVLVIIIQLFIVYYKICF